MATPRHRATAVVIVLIGLAVFPLIVSAVRLGAGWVPFGDEATIVLRGDDLLTAETPLVGMPSTLGASTGDQVHHPGPLESQAIGAVALVIDDPRVAVGVVALVNGLALIAALLWCLRMGGPRTLAVAVPATTVLLWSLRGPILATPYNPYAALLPFLACLVSLGAVATGHRWATVTAVGFGSWAAQAHLTVAGSTAAAAGATVLLVLLRVRQQRVEQTADEAREVGDSRRPLLSALALGVALWAAPAVDVVANGGGNVLAVLRSSGSLEGDTLGAERAFGVIVNAVGVRPAWTRAGIGAHELLAAPSQAAELAASVLLLAALAVAWACRRTRPGVTHCIAVSGAALAVGGLLASKIPDRLFNAYATHNYVWLWPVSAILWVATLLGLVHLAARRTATRRGSRRWVTGSAVALALLFALASLEAPHRDPGTKEPVYARSIAAQVITALDPEGRYVVDLSPDIATYNQGTALLYALEQRGFDVRVPAEYEAAFGSHRIAREPRHQLIVRITRDMDPPPSDTTTLASFVPATDLLRRRAIAERTIIDEVRQRGGTVVGGIGRIEPSEAREWVESGGFLATLDFGLVEPAIAELEASDELLELQREPAAFVSVHLREVEPRRR